MSNISFEFYISCLQKTIRHFIEYFNVSHILLAQVPQLFGKIKDFFLFIYCKILFGCQDRSCEIVEDMEAGRARRKKRICLVLDCLCAHDFSDKTVDLINLQHYVIKEKRLSEREAIIIFCDVVRVVEALHKVSISL